MKILTLALAIITVGIVSGCSDTATGMPRSVEERCINGVIYYSSVKRLAPKFTQDSKVVVCNWIGIKK